MQSAAEKMRVGDQAEEAAEAALAAAGWDVINLNRLAKNFRFADLLAKLGTTRVLVQVKGTTTGEGKFGALPEPARALHALASHLEAHAVYALVRLAPGGPDIRFGSAEDAAALADQRIADYPGKLRFHLFLDDFEHAAEDLQELLP
jgi:Holliday junction resolvase-like predicted endonuclease